MHKKVIVIGCPGSGKSFFSKRLNEITGIPVYYLDKIYWKPNWEHLNDEELTSQISSILRKDSYIIDGNYQRFLENRFKEAETIFFLDIDEKHCLKSVQKRQNHKRDDFPEFLDEEVDEDFTNFIKNFKNDGRKTILNLINIYKDKEIIIFKNRREIQRFTKSLEKSKNFEY